MQTYDCPNPSSVKFTVVTLKQKLKTDKEFAEFFVEQVKLGLGGDQNAKDCVDSYYEPTNSEMDNLGIPSSKFDVMRKCTESGLLLLVAAKEGASQAI
jgi:hypothetical protein